MELVAESVWNGWDLVRHNDEFILVHTEDLAGDGDIYFDQIGKEKDGKFVLTEVAFPFAKQLKQAARREANRQHTTPEEAAIMVVKAMRAASVRV